MTSFYVKLYSLFLVLFLSGLNTQAQTKKMIVALDGSGQFTNIQSAINAVPSNSEEQVIIYLKNGVYDQEKLIIPADKKT